MNWLSGLDDKTRLTFLNRVINKDCTLGQVKQVVKKHKVFEFINKLNLFNFIKEMLWAQQVFINDTKKKDWNDAIREFGPGVESALRTFASTLKVVKTSELKNVNEDRSIISLGLKKLLERFKFLFLNYNNLKIGKTL